MGWILLGLTVVSEVTGTTFMKLSEGYSKLGPSILSFVFYGLTLVLLTFTLKHLGMGIVYAIWSGLGLVLVTILGAMFFNEPVSLLKILCIASILAGVVGLRLISVQ